LFVLYYLDLPEEVREFCSRVGGDHGKQLAAAYKAQTRQPSSSSGEYAGRMRRVGPIEYVHWKLIGDQLSLPDCHHAAGAGRNSRA